jgi:oxygen-dependent protoporphyrinogen oxidase
VLPRFAEMAEQYGSLTRGVLAERAKAKAKAKGREPAPLFRTLKGGLGQMVDAASRAIAGSTEIRQGHAETVERTPNGFRVKVAGDWLEAGSLVLACEAHNAAKLVSSIDGQLAELLGAVPYSSSMTVALGYAAADFAHAPGGFGFLIPKKERRKLVACTWVGTKFSHRVPGDKIVARCFLGGTEGAGVLEESDDAIIAAVTEELREIAGVTARPLFSRIFRWPRSMAQFVVGHRARQSEVEARVSGIPGLHLAGNAYYGIGIPDCIRLGKAAADKILAG